MVLIRKNFLTIIPTLVLALLIGCGGGSSEGESSTTEQSTPDTPEGELIQAMDLAIKLAESDSIRALFARFSPPEDFQKLEDSGQLKAAMDRFNIFRYHFVEALKEARTLQPTFNEDTTRAVYEVLEVEVPGHMVAFQKIGEEWYFSD